MKEKMAELEDERLNEYCKDCDEGMNEEPMKII